MFWILNVSINRLNLLAVSKKKGGGLARWLLRSLVPGINSSGHALIAFRVQICPSVIILTLSVKQWMCAQLGS